MSAATIGAALVVYGLIGMARAEPITLHCKLVSERLDVWGPLVVTVDESGHDVRVDIPKIPDLRNDYRDGLEAPVISWRGSDEPQQRVAAFVKSTPLRVEFGWRSIGYGELGHLIWIDRTALTGRTPCLFHSLWRFARA